MMRKQLTKEMRAYWQSFGVDRFTKQDLWRLFMGRYYDSGGKESWPKDDFTRWLALERKPWVVSVPGPRGGEGWCLSKDLVDAFRKEEGVSEEQKARAESLAASVRPRLGVVTVRVDIAKPEQWLVEWVFRPPVPIPGHDVGGQWRSEPGDVFIFNVKPDVTPGEFQALIDQAEARIQECIAEEKGRLEQSLKALNSMGGSQ